MNAWLASWFDGGTHELAGVTLTIAAGSAEAEVTAETDDLGLAVPAGTGLRWKVVSGPGAETTAWGATVGMWVKGA